MKRILKRVLAASLMITISLVVSGLLGELIIRFTIKDDIVLFPRYHTDATYGDYRIRRFRPNSSFTHTSVDGQWDFEINSQGFRGNKNFDYRKPADTLRVLALGDSHTAGYEVAQDESYSAVLEKLLTRDGRKAEVLNTGVSGFGTAEELVFLANEGIRYQPDIVVLGFYANDLQDNVKAGLFSLADGELVVEKLQHTPGIRIQNLLNDFALIRWLSENSYFFSFTFNSVYEIAKSAMSQSAQEDVITEYAIPVGDFTEYEYTLAAALVTEIARICHENGAKLIVLDIPAPSSDNRIVPSVKTEIRDVFVSASDAFIDSRQVLANFPDSGIPIHVAHGHQHISRATHNEFANEIASKIDILLAIED